jgi:hypothetical protein
MKTLTALIVLAFTATPALAVADGPKASRASKSTATATNSKATTKAKYKKVRELIFTDDEVTAARAGGAGEIIQVRVQTKKSSLIRIRGNFLPELVKSAENI